MSLIFLSIISVYGQPHAQIFQKEVLSSCIYLISIGKQSSSNQTLICSQKHGLNSCRKKHQQKFKSGQKMGLRDFGICHAHVTIRSMDMVDTHE